MSVEYEGVGYDAQYLKGRHAVYAAERYFLNHKVTRAVGEVLFIFATGGLGLGVSVGRRVGASLALRAFRFGRAAKTSSRILNMTTKQLQKKYLKHAADFGIRGNWNKAAASKFSSRINQHINSLDVKIIQGTYKNQPAIHYLNPKTGVNVISHPNGQFWSGWKLGSQQLQGVLKNGTLW